MTIELYKNSFVTLEEAQNYFDERFDSKEWFATDETEQEKLLIKASKKISMFDFVGEPVEKNQPMTFPRNFDLPQDIKDAVCEEAITLIQKNQNIHLVNQESNITSISLGVGSVSYGAASNSDEAKILVSPIASYLVKKWIKKGYNIPF